jgi:modification methylase
MNSDTRVDSPRLPRADNTSTGLKALLQANEHYRVCPWPEPFCRTQQRLHLGDARDLCWIPDRSVHLVVTSPPYWTLKEYRRTPGQMGHIEDYETFLRELDKVWRECVRVLVPGGRICCVVGDVCVPRKNGGRHYIIPLHADIQVRARALGVDCLTPILWHKIANGATEVKGNGAGFYGKPYQPGAIVKNDIEHILFLRKGGEYRSVPPIQKALSMLTRDEMQAWFVSFWNDIPGSSTRAGHPAPFPTEIANRLIRMFSFAGDTVLDPFVGTGSTCEAAIETGRNSIGVDIDAAYLKIAQGRLVGCCSVRRLFGPLESELLVDPS